MTHTFYILRDNTVYVHFTVGLRATIVFGVNSKFAFSTHHKLLLVV